MTDFLPYGQQWIDEDDIQSVVEVLKGDWLTTGPNVDEFEEALIDSTGADHAIAINSGTAALHCAYEAAGVDADSEVIVPSMTFSATANAARYLGADVKFADIESETLTMDPASVDALSGPETTVIAPVDFTGHPAKLEELREIADSCGAVLVEDAAHSIGGAYRGDPIGSIADLTCFSFHPVKTITTGEGGAVVTDRDEWADRMRELRTHGQQPDVEGLHDDPDPGGWAYDIDQIGYNYRITDIQCALGLSQLRKLEDFVVRRQEIAGRYRDLLDDAPHVELPPDREWCRHPYHLFVVRVPADHRKAIFEDLREENIGVQVHYIPANMLSYYRDRGHDPEETPVALENYRRMISIPCFPKMSDDDIERVVGTLRDVVRHHTE